MYVLYLPSSFLKETLMLKFLLGIRVDNYNTWFRDADGSINMNGVSPVKGEHVDIVLLSNMSLHPLNSTVVSNLNEIAKCLGYR